MMKRDSRFAEKASHRIALKEYRKKEKTIVDELSTYYTKVIYKTGQCLRNHTLVYADRYKCLFQSGVAKIGLLHLSSRY